uniref:NADH dehydrogenase subunit 4L n=1 Tax=Phallusia fumigata TaxID=395376 RepID=A7WL91_9ASCI|nr:NADH dehydrogenase subunit 4L [Phallusia fumigata]CAL24359.1 NADH dehydrogenase subunit 4L [Phallusia fumigata]
MGMMWILVVGLLVGGLGFVGKAPIVMLVNLEFLYLLVVVFFMLTGYSVMGWWGMFLLVFGACEGVLMLTVNMVVGKFIGLAGVNKFMKW